jgi:ATP-binding cassette subfamily F protein 3
MSILTANDLGQSFGADDLFSSINLELAARDRVGLVGPNGVGKTTLLLILAGLHEPSAGIVQRARDLTLGYLQQEAVLTFANHNHTIYEEMLSVFAGLRQQESQLQEMEAAMAAGDVSETLFEEYGRLQERYEHGGGYQYQIDIKRVLLGLGFPEEQWQMPLAHLSGGQKTRVLLGRLLLEKPDLLILDEPTNHLDMVALEWLEQTLRQWEGALLIVSHDRYFLDRIVNQVWEMRHNEMRTYRGNYSAYVRQRQEAWEREAALFKAEKARLESELDFIRKHIGGGQADIAKGKLKRLTRDVTLIEQVGVVGRQNKSWLEAGGRVRTLSANEAARRIRDLTPPSNRPPRLNIRLETEERSGRVVLRTKNLEVGYPGRLLFTSDDIRLERHDCVALIGPNGSGKSTFLRTLMGALEPLAGDIYLGDNLRLGYFAQAHDQLKLSRQVIEEVLAHKPMNEAEARHYLAQYLFRGDDVFKRVSELSGGERGRLALALLALDEANFLLLDEPTNHLDIPAQEVLQEVLEAFEGTILLVSHDRYLLDRLATQIWEVRDERLYIFKGTYHEYLEAREAEASGVEPAVPEPPPVIDWVQEIVAPPLLSHKEIRQRERRLRELEDAIDNLEAWLAQVDYELDRATAAEDEVRSNQLQNEYAQGQAELAALNAEWDGLTGDLVSGPNVG